MYVPFNMMKSSFGTSDFSNVSLQVESADDIKSAGKEAAQLVNDNHGTEDSYQVMNMEEIAAGIGKVTAIMTTIIGSKSLIISPWVARVKQKKLPPQLRFWLLKKQPTSQGKKLILMAVHTWTSGSMQSRYVKHA